ncbi:MAG: phage major capsid protein [Thermoguttaceae bacterium]
MHKIKLLNEQKTTLIKANKDILQSCESDDRDMTAEENKTFDANSEQIDKINAAIERRQRMREQSLTSERAFVDGPGETHGPVFQQTSGSGLQFHNAATGQLVRALQPDERFCTTRIGGGASNVLGQAIHSWLTGRTDSPEFQAAAQQGNIDTGGGFLFEPRMSAMFVDLARAASVCLRAGAQTVPMETGELVLATLTNDPTSYWRAEGTGVTASGATFGRVNLRAKTLAAIVPITLELLEDSMNAAQLIESALSASLALKLDQAALAGTGAASEPRGIRNHSGVNTVTSVGAQDDYSDVVSAMQKVLAANYNGAIDDLSWIGHPRDFATYQNLVAVLDGQYLVPPPWVQQLRQFATTSIATTEGVGGNESYSVVGDFSQLLIGMRTTGVILKRIPAGQIVDGNGNTHSAPSELKEFLVAYMRADVTLLRPTWFTVLSGITEAV